MNRARISDRTARPTEVARDLGIPVTPRMRATEAQWAEDEACNLLDIAECFAPFGAATYRNLDRLSVVEEDALAQRLSWLLEHDSADYFEKSLLLAQQLYQEA